MPPDSRQFDVQQERGERNPTPTHRATRQELATAAGAGGVKLTEPKLLPDEQELRRIIDLIPQTIGVLNPAKLDCFTQPREYGVWKSESSAQEISHKRSQSGR